MRQCQDCQNHFVTILSPCAIWFVSPNRIWTDNTMNTAVASISCNWPDVTSANSGFHTNGKEFPQQCIAMTLHLSICSFDSLVQLNFQNLQFCFYFFFILSKMSFTSILWFFAIAFLDRNLFVLLFFLKFFSLLYTSSFAWTISMVQSGSKNICS